MTEHLLCLSDKQYSGLDEVSILALRDPGKEYLQLDIDGSDRVLGTFLIGPTHARKLAVALLYWAGKKCPSEEIGEALANEITSLSARLDKIEAVFKAFV